MKINCRVDHLTAFFVNTAIAISERNGEMTAIQLLLSRKLERAVITRVLTEPNCRRSRAFRRLHG